jgi:predicted nuclease of predicted toxin-antitoxin system
LTEPPAIRLVLDQGVPRDAAELLRALGYECIHVGDIGMWNASDEEILKFATGKQATIVTLDADFHTILAVSGSQQPSIIRIRIESLRAHETSELIQRVVAEFSDDLQHGVLISVKTRKTTCHRLPIGGRE